MKKSLAIVVVLAMAATANAGVTTYFVEQAPQTIDGNDWRVWDMMADVGSDWLNVRMDMVLTSGTMYQNIYGSDIHPSDVLVDVFPDLAFDTFATVPGGNTFTVGVADGGMTETEIHMSWFDKVEGTGGIYRIAQITLSTNANGDLVPTVLASNKNYDWDTAGFGVRFDEWYIEEGAFVPEPATLVLLAIGGIGALLRKRR